MIVTALTHSSMEAVNILLSIPGINVACADTRGTTPLHWASVCNRPEVCRLLLHAGAPALARDSSGMTAMHYAHKKVWEYFVLLFTHLGHCTVLTHC